MINTMFRVSDVQCEQHDGIEVAHKKVLNDSFERHDP